MATTIRTILAGGIFICLICFTSNDAKAGKRRVPVAVVPAPVAVAAPVVVPMPVGSFADVRDYPGGVLYGGAYRVKSPVFVPAPRYIRRAVRYGPSTFVGPRGYAAVVTPWPLVPVTTVARPYGVGVVPLGAVTAWQSPAGYVYRGSYQSAVLQPPCNCPPNSPNAVESVPPATTFETPLEPIPAPPAEIGPEF